MKNTIRGIAAIILVSLIGVNASLSAKTSAAGKVSVEVTASSQSVAQGSNFTETFYVNASEASITGLSVNVTLDKATFVSYDASGSPFSFNSTSLDGSGNTSVFSIIAGYSGDASGTGRILIGKATLVASASGATTTSVADIQAYDTANDPMDNTTPNQGATTVSVNVGPPGSGSQQRTANSSTFSVPGDNNNPVAISDKGTANILGDQAGQDSAKASSSSKVKRNVIIIAAVLVLIILLAVWRSLSKTKTPGNYNTPPPSSFPPTQNYGPQNPDQQFPPSSIYPDVSDVDARISNEPRQRS